MSVWWSQTMVQGVGWTLLHFLWQGLVIAALLAIGLRLLRRGPAHQRYLAGCAALLLMTLAPLVTFQLVLKQDEPPPLPMVEPVVAEAPAPMEHVARPATALPKIVVTATREPHARKASWRLESLMPWLVAAWFAGVCGLSCRLFAGWLQIRRLRNADAEALADGWPEKLNELARRLGVNRPLRLLRTACVEVPTVIGWLRPVILLPAACLTGLTRAQLESIIAHELAHIRRHDYLINLLQNAAETLLFYHPAVWWVSRRIREERENCCDDLVVEVCGDRVGYARALATLEELRPASAQLALAAGGAPLLQRIRRVLGQGERNAVRPAWPLAGVLVIALLALAGLEWRGHRADAAVNNPAAMAVEHKSAMATNDPNAEAKIILMDAPGADTNAGPRDPWGNPYVITREANPSNPARETPASGTNTGSWKVEILDTNSGQLMREGSNATVSVQLSNDSIEGRVNTLVQDGRFYFQAGKYDEAEAKFKEALKLAPANVPASQYVKLIVEKRALQSSDQPSAVLRTRSYAVSRAFFGELEHATGESFGPVGPGYRSVAEVLAQRKAVESAARKYFTAAGLDFDISTGKTVTFNTSSLTVRATPSDLDAILPLMRTLNQTPSATDNLEALETRTFRVDPNIFRQGLESARAFKLTPNGQRVVQPAATSTNKNAPMEEQIRELFRNAGVGLDSDNSGTVVIWNGNRGTLTVRATPQDLDLIEAAIQIINAPAPEVNIKAKFVEITHPDGDTNLVSLGVFRHDPPEKGMGSNGTATRPPNISPSSNQDYYFVTGALKTTGPGSPFTFTTNHSVNQAFANQMKVPMVATVTGILTDPQYRTVLQALEQRDGVDILTMPEVTTESGRQAQMQCVDIQGVVMNTNSNALGSTNFSVVSVPLGPTLDVFPEVSVDEFTIRLKLTTTVTEFLGYDDPGQFVLQVTQTNGTKVKSVLPLPRFRLRQAMTSVSVWDAQTVVIGGFEPVESAETVKDKVPLLGDIPLMGRLFRSEHVKRSRKELLVFITPTIINPDGTRFHSDEEMPLVKSAPPGQAGTNSTPNK